MLGINPTLECLPNAHKAPRFDPQHRESSRGILDFFVG